MAIGNGAEAAARDAGLAGATPAPTPLAGLCAGMVWEACGCGAEATSVAASDANSCGAEASTCISGAGAGGVSTGGTSVLGRK